ncbi:hypothetical protein [Clostridium sp.]|uniref:hypothetical protein n=1 Tax=Clostridium sp. TaxID=1506 RepID=UPI00262EA3CB|nr:hypothetical protein [Clostridium sp.]
MALWQVEFMIIPKEKIIGNTNVQEINIADLWNGYKIKENTINQVEKVLKRNKSWSEDIVQLGDTSETVIEIVYDNDMIEEITCRLDLRNITKKIVETILNFIEINNLAVIVNNKIYTNLTKGLIIDIVNESDAYKFINNPEKFLEEL